MRRRVVCGLSETITTLPPQSALTSVDLPTFGRPATATKPLFIERFPHYPHPGRGCSPLTRYCERTDDSVTRLCRFCADSARQLPRLRQQVARRRRHHLVRGVAKHDPVERELPQPLPTSAAGGRRDRHRLDVTGPVARGHRGGDRRPLRAHPERIRRVLDVDAFED